jgi:lipoate-protein ligase B
VHRVNRGGGCVLHAPGQLVGYSVLALDALSLNVQQYLDRLHALLQQVFVDLDVPAEIRPGHSGLWVGQRRLAHVGVAVRDWVSSFGFAVNVQPDLALFQKVQCDGDTRPMTSITRERRLPIRPATVRQRLLEGFASALAFDRVSLFHAHPTLNAKAATHAVTSASR